MPFYDPYSGVEVETDEERKKREEEAANTVAHKQETTTYADGSQTRTTTQEIPAGQPQVQQPAQPVTPQSLGINYGLGQPQTQPTVLQQPKLPTQVAPVQPQQPTPQPQVAGAGRGFVNPTPIAPAIPNQAQYTAQMESGNNPNIGYHNPNLGTAYGTYGLTAPAYSDVQRANPAFANRPITSLSPEEQTQAYDTYTNLNKQSLQKFGVEPSDANARLAHFLGAKGARDYLSTGAISPQAAAANGGEAKVRQIAEQRLAGGVAPASGALNQPISAPAQQAPEVSNTIKGIEAYQTVQDNADNLFKLGNDESQPEFIRKRAKDRYVELYNQDKTMKQAESELTKLGPNDMAKVLTRKSEGNSVGDWLQYLLYKHVGLSDLANEKGEQLGIGHKWQTAYIQDATGRDVPVEIQTSASGRLLQGKYAGTDKTLTPDQLTQAAGAIQNADALKTAQTQATHAYTQAYTSLMKQRDALTQQGATDQDLVSRGLDMNSIQTRAQQAGQSVIQAARSQYRPQGTPAVQQPAGATTMPSMTGGPALGGGAPAQAPAPTKAPTYTTESGKPSLLDNWDAFRPNESAKAKAARSSIQPSEIDSAAQALVEGRVKPTEFTGRGSEFRRLATERALELDSKYSPMRYDQVNKVIQRYTSGKDHETLLNTGTAVNHLAQFKDIAAQTPGNTNVSSWNTFYQNLMKYGNAPEIKSKEAMAGFVAGELVKAASGGHGSMTERTHLEQQLMKANTPSEITAIVDNSIKLAHGRYSSMKSSYEASTGRKDFDEISGMPSEARREFGKIEGTEAAKTGFKDADKEARYQAWKKQQGMK